MAFQSCPSVSQNDLGFVILLTLILRYLHDLTCHCIVVMAYRDYQKALKRLLHSASTTHGDNSPFLNGTGKENLTVYSAHQAANNVRR